MKKIIMISLLSIFLSCSPNKKNIMQKHQFNFYTQYNQFYLTSDNGSSLTQNNSWDEKDYVDRLSSLKNFIAYFSESYGDIKGELIVLEKPTKEIDYNKYDHIVETGISVESGLLQVLDCPNSSVELEVKLKPGNYRVRIYGSNFASVKENDLAHDSDNDFYKIEVWPDDNMERKVLKQYVKK
ncbi:hypothetical protein [Flavobacterium humi]|uniref:Lipoprotein n=1 Tax=Flavobacterium humi TaxID=2562683 RepID=A0A4Z0L2K2_9FLAO|nr:hypothetical protein [Flavobacterium humi]TGD56540.1 hypothetical protein E4635_15580 [Flavobacterium humi]